MVDDLQMHGRWSTMYDKCYFDIWQMPPDAREMTS